MENHTNMDRVLHHGLLRDVLEYIETVLDPNDGCYDLFGPRGIMAISEDTPCAIILILHDDSDDYLPVFAIENGLEPIYIISDAINVIKVAKEDKPTATISDLVAALNYYMDHDAFLDLTAS